MYLLHLVKEDLNFYLILQNVMKNFKIRLVELTKSLS